MTRIGPDPGPRDLAALVRALRLGAAGTGELAGTGSTPVPPVPPVVPADGPRTGDRRLLHDLQHLLRSSLGPPESVEQVVQRLYETLTRLRPELSALLPGDTPRAHQAELRAALTWLVGVLDRPQLAAAGCAQLGAVLRELGVPPGQLHVLGPGLLEALRAALGPDWRPEYDLAWRSTWELAERWIAGGAEAAGYQPVFWTAVVTTHERRLADLAVLRARPYLPYPYRAGQYTTVESPAAAGLWRPYSLATAPAADNTVELHVRAKSDEGVSGALVYRTAPGDRVRLRVAAGTMALDDGDRDLLLIAGDTGIAPFKALLGELAGTPGHRSAVLFWGVRSRADLYDFAAVDALAQACGRATVVPVVSHDDPGPYAAGLVTDAVAAYGEWSAHEAYVAGPPAMVAATVAVLATLGVPAERMHHDPYA